MESWLIRHENYLFTFSRQTSIPFSLLQNISLFLVACIALKLGEQVRDVAQLVWPLAVETRGQGFLNPPHSNCGGTLV